MYHLLLASLWATGDHSHVAGDLIGESASEDDRWSTIASRWSIPGCRAADAGPVHLVIDKRRVELAIAWRWLTR